MASVLAIVSKAVFEKSAPKGVKVGDVLATDRYTTKTKTFDAIASGGAIFLVTVRPPDEQLWLVGILENPRYDENAAAWIAAANTTPIANVTPAIASFVFANGQGLHAKKGALGMSLQTPRVLTDDDEKLLRSFAGAPLASVAAPVASAKADGLTFTNFKAARSLKKMTAVEKKRLEDFRETIEQQEEFDGVQSFELVDASGRIAYYLYWWPFTDGVMVDAKTGEALGDLCDGFFTLREPSRPLRERITAAYQAARANGSLENILFSEKGETETAPSRKAPAAVSGSPANFDAFDSFDWRKVNEAYKKAYGGEFVPENNWFTNLVDAKKTPLKAVESVRCIEAAIGLVNEASEPTVQLLGEVLRDHDGQGCRVPGPVLALLGELATGGGNHDIILGFDRTSSDAATQGIATAVEKSVPNAATFLAHRDPKVRVAAAWAIAWSAPMASELVPPLRAALSEEEDAGAAVGMLLSLSLNLGYIKASRDELRAWLTDGRREVAAAAVSVLVLHAGESDPTWLPVLEAALKPTAPAPPAGNKKKAADAGVITNFHFAGGRIENLILTALARLSLKLPDAKRTLTALFDDTTLTTIVEMNTRSTAGGKLAHALGVALPKTVNSAADLSLEQRELLTYVAAQLPLCTFFGFGLRTPTCKVPRSQLELGRWLGIRRTSPRERISVAGKPLRDAVLAAVRGSDSLVAAAANIAAALDSEDALILVSDLIEPQPEYGNFTNIADLKTDYKEMDDAGKRNMGLEIVRRAARLIELVREILVAKVELSSVLAALKPRLGQGVGYPQRSAALSCLVLAAGTLAEGRTLELDANFVAVLPAVAVYRDFAEPVRRLLETCPPPQRQNPFMTGFDFDHQAARWLYLDLVDVADLELIAQSYNLLPNEELTASWIARVGKIDPAGVNKILALIERQYGAAQPAPREAARVIEFHRPDGSPISLWASPPLTTVLDRAPWFPTAEQQLPA